MIENFKLHVSGVVADTLNSAKAAEELHLPHPAVTSQVRSLEEGLRVGVRAEGFIWTVSAVNRRFDTGYVSSSSTTWVSRDRSPAKPQP
jgi:Bacterial regulatory helix-turn-helix protein, lysR family